MELAIIRKSDQLTAALLDCSSEARQCDFVISEQGLDYPLKYEFEVGFPQES